MQYRVGDEIIFSDVLSATDLPQSLIVGRVYVITDWSSGMLKGVVRDTITGEHQLFWGELDEAGIVNAI